MVPKEVWLHVLQIKYDNYTKDMSNILHNTLYGIIINKGPDELIDFIHGSNLCGKELNKLAIYWAVQRSRLWAIPILAEHVDVDWENDFGNTALYFARMHPLEYTQTLVEYGANVNASNWRGESPLHYASLSNNLGVVQYFIDNDADVNARTHSGATPLTYANDQSTRTLLIQNGGIM